MRFKFDEDKIYNRTGGNNSRVHAKKGEVHDLPAYLCRMLSDWGHILESAPTEQPTAGPTEQKATYTSEQHGAWFWILDEDGDVIDKVQGKDNAELTLRRLNEQLD